MLERIYLGLGPLLLFLLKALARVSTKFAELVKTREGLLDRWRKAPLGKDPLWVHVSSVGELEQARPVMEYLQSRGHKIVLSYFSPSVPRLVKDWSFVSYADYLPFDAEEDMKELMALVKPKALILNRYDLWPNHLAAAKQAGVPVFLINASTPPLGWFGQLSLHVRRSIFAAIDGWTFVDAIAAAAWEPYINLPARGLVAGDPRVDRALKRAEKLIAEGKARTKLGRWRRKGFCLVAGSTWPQDEEVLLKAWALVKGEKSLVIVPHEPEEAHLLRLEKELQRHQLSFARFSRLGESETDVQVLIVDQRGFLAEIYGLGELAYVGGGFNRHIHSIIEPIAHGLLVAFGPRYARSPEAYTLRAAGAACALEGRGKARQLAHWISEMRENQEERDRAKDALRVFIQVHSGAGERAGEFVEKRLRG